MLLQAFYFLFIIFGIYGLLKGEIPLVGKVKITGTAARLTGVVLIILGLLALVGGSAVR